MIITVPNYEAMQKWIKLTLGTISVIIFLIAVVAVVSYIMLKKPVPEYEGNTTVSGIKSNVEIYRDEHGVAYINADDQMDAVYALGYVHAQERLFQMDLLKRSVAGRLSEVMGSKTVPFDRMFKTLGLEKTVEQNYSKLHPTSKQILEAYSNGVNAFINGDDIDYPVEFDILGYEPGKWKPKHSLLISKLLSWQLNISWWTDITYVHLLQKFGKEKVMEILPDYPENAPTIIPEGIDEYADISTDFIETDRRFRKFIGFEGTHIGSNNWVVNEEMSKSGAPIIANDPHLTHSVPSTWYMAVINSDQLNVTGFTLPGLPAVVIGKNSDISWVMTNVMADDADFYVEKLDSAKQKYFYDEEWRKLGLRKDTIVVKDSSNVVMEVRSTHRGPIISGIHPYEKLYPDAEVEKPFVSMKWTAYDFSDELFAIYSINTAGNWSDFKEALSHYNSPGQNFVYADDEGNIGYICAAKLPIRESMSPTMIYDGTKANNDWKGYLPYSEMPKLYNPPENLIASANNKTVEEFPYHISNIWEPPSRINRILELLNSKDKHSVNDFKKYQTDQVSLYSKRIVPHILKAFQNTEVQDRNLKTALELLDSWNFDMEKQSQVPTIYAVFFQKLLKNIFEDEMGEDLLNEFVFLANIPYKTIDQILNKGFVTWFNDVTTDKTESKKEIIRKSLVDALDELEKKFGKDIESWQWRKLHKLTLEHPFSGFNEMVDNLVNIGPFEIGGD